MTLSTFPTFLTFLTFGLVRAGWLKLVTSKRATAPSIGGTTSAFFRGTYARKVGKVKKGVCVMTLSTFPTLLAFLTRKLRWIRANQETLPEIRREAVGRQLAAEQTRSLLDGLVRAGCLRLMMTKTAAAPSIGGVSTRCFFPGHQRQKGQKGQKVGARHDAEHHSDLSDLSDLVTQKLCFPAVAGAPCQDPEIPPYAGRQRLGPPTVGPAGRPESWSQVATAPRWRLRDRRNQALR